MKGASLATLLGLDDRIAGGDAVQRRTGRPSSSKAASGATCPVLLKLRRVRVGRAFSPQSVPVPYASAMTYFSPIKNV